MTSSLLINVKGIVQGVGFRPFVYRLAIHYGLNGWVLNSSKGVEIEIQGKREQIDAFLHELKHHPPPLAVIDTVEIREFQSPAHYDSFSILESRSDANEFIPISADISICDDCLTEMQNPADRRFRYPFINCTNCGPRFSIIKEIPYDRPKTTMADFQLCEDCLAEYSNPGDRRFHAQPVACPQCGPHVYLQKNGTTIAEKEDAIQLARAAIMEGQIIAIKGLGGYHIACDAKNTLALTKLRERKKRSDKPFALMAASIAVIKRYCHVSKTEEELLKSPQHPIVLLDRLPQNSLPKEIAPGQSTLGFMLPYTPLHVLLLDSSSDFTDLLIMTSGNLSEEPIAYSDDDALVRLSPMADLFLMHNRPIFMRVDDSVSREINGFESVLRRARGYAPAFLHFPFKSAPILAVGAGLKNTFCLTRDHQAFLSHHIGDLENYETLQSFEEGILHYEKLFRTSPKRIACDLHPDYLSTRYAVNRAENEQKPLLFVQHHHAHLAACLAENGWNDNRPVIGLLYDGTGMGSDGAIWGGEVFVGGFADFQRHYHLKYVPLVGGDLAVRKPARMALAYLWTNGYEWDSSFPCAQSLCMEDRTVIRSQLEKEINSPPTSSMGRLFDAVSAFLGVRQEVNYEGQAAIELENIVDHSERGCYPIEINVNEMDTKPLWGELIHDMQSGTALSIMAARFHNSIVQLSLSVSVNLRNLHGINTVALSGGVWQNKVLLTRTISLLQNNNFDVLWHKNIPANDGGVAYGQACIAAHSI